MKHHVFGVKKLSRILQVCFKCLKIANLYNTFMNFCDKSCTYKDFLLVSIFMIYERNKLILSDQNISLLCLLNYCHDFPGQMENSDCK